MWRMVSGERSMTAGTTMARLRRGVKQCPPPAALRLLARPRDIAPTSRGDPRSARADQRLEVDNRIERTGVADDRHGLAGQVVGPAPTVGPQADAPVERARGVVLLDDPDHEPEQAPGGQLGPRTFEQGAAETAPLGRRMDVEHLDLAGEVGQLRLFATGTRQGEADHAAVQLRDEDEVVAGRGAQAVAPARLQTLLVETGEVAGRDETGVGESPALGVDAGDGCAVSRSGSANAAAHHLNVAGRVEPHARG